MTDTCPNKMPTIFIAHGGGPGFFLDDDSLRSMGGDIARDLGPNSVIAKHLRALPLSLPTPTAILLMSAHYEVSGKGVAVYQHSNPGMLYDYYGFPESAYRVQYPAPGLPSLGREVQRLLADHGVACDVETERGYDHGCFAPLMMMYPDANIPVVQLSLNSALDPKFHYTIGKFLAPLRDQGVLIIGSGFSVHNLRNRNLPPSHTKAWDDWLNAACGKSGSEREALLSGWSKAPYAKEVHPREEHLIPLHVAAGAAENETGVADLRTTCLSWHVSGFVFGK